MQIGLIFVGFALLLVLQYAARQFARKQKKLSQPHLGTVLKIAQTSEREGSLVKVEVEVEIAGRNPRRTMVRQWMKPGRLPHPGQVVRLVHQGGALLLVGFADQAIDEAPREAASGQREATGVLTAAELTEDLRRHGTLSIATVQDAHLAGGGRTRLTLDIDAIGSTPRRVVLEQPIPIETYGTGERAYLLVDAGNAGAMNLLMPSQIGDQRLPREMNRLDPFVLGPQLLHKGARARGVVLSAAQVPLGPEYEVRGLTRFQIRFRIEPEIGVEPYEAEQTITLTRPEKIPTMTTPGAIVPLRFDVAHPETFATDSVAMGYGDPYAEAVNLFREQLSTVGGR